MPDSYRYWFDKTQWLDRAKKKFGQADLHCLWYRGILPWHLSWGMCEPTPEPSHWELHKPSFVLGIFDESSELFSDGAGPSKAQDGPNYTKRVGAGGAALKWDGEELSQAALLGTRVSGNQTVPRAELSGGITMWQEVAPTMIGVDAACFVNGLAKLRESGNFVSKNHDLWHLVNAQVQSHPAAHVRKVKAHASIQQVLRNQVEWKDYVGNNLADFAARLAEEGARQTEPVMHFARKHDQMAFAIVMRLATIEAARADLLAEVTEWELQPVAQAVTVAAQKKSLQSKLKDSGHVLRKFSDKRMICIRCRVTRPITQFKQWLDSKCTTQEGNHDLFWLGGLWQCRACGLKAEKLEAFEGHCSTGDTDLENEFARSEPEAADAGIEKAETFKGNYLQFQRESAKRRQVQKSVLSANRAASKAALANFVEALPTDSAAVDPAKPPPWIDQLNKTHTLSYVSVFSVKCARPLRLGPILLPV